MPSAPTLHTLQGLPVAFLTTPGLKSVHMIAGRIRPFVFMHDGDRREASSRRVRQGRPSLKKKIPIIAHSGFSRAEKTMCVLSSLTVRAFSNASSFRCASLSINANSRSTTSSLMEKYEKNNSKQRQSSSKGTISKHTN